MFTDIESFSAASRNDHDRRAIREVLYEVMRDALQGRGLHWNDLYHEDRGDGTLSIAPPEVPTAALIDPFLSNVSTTLHNHNRRAGTAVQIRLRVALHVGPVHADRHGVSGHAINQTARLLEAPALKNAMQASDADLGFITSAFVYENVIAQGGGNPSAYRQIKVAVKETSTTAWMHLSGSTPRPPVSVPVHDPVPAPVSFNAAIRVTGDLVLGNKILYSPFTPD